MAFPNPIPFGPSSKDNAKFAPLRKRSAYFLPDFCWSRQLQQPGVSFHTPVEAVVAAVPQGKPYKK